jgi:hypothetical protein
MEPNNEVEAAPGVDGMVNSLRIPDVPDNRNGVIPEIRELSGSPRLTAAKRGAEMPARVVIVHDDASVLHPLAQALEGAGLGVAAFDNSFAAWHALGRAATVEMLITGTRFHRSSPQGLALKVQTRKRRPGVKAVFIGAPRSRIAFSRIGEFVPYQPGHLGDAPIDIPAALAVIARLLGSTFISPQSATVPRSRPVDHHHA